MKDRWVAALIGAAAFAVFLASPVRHRSDARYTLLLSEQLLTRRTFRLDEHFSPENAGVPGQPTYNLQASGPHVYFRPAPGSAVLSVPFVPLLRVFGLSAVDAEGRYDPSGDLRAQATLAALLMAGLTSLFYLTARLLLPVAWSLGVAIAGSLGTQVWSTASRALWTHTWEIALVGVVVWHLTRAEVLRRPLRPIALAVLLAAAFTARPTAAGHALAVAAYLAVFRREAIVRFVTAAGVMLAALVAGSSAVYGQPLPPAFHLWQRASLGWQPALAALTSPSRGLLVCVPLVPLVAALLVRYRRHTPSRPLVFVAAAGFVTQLAGAAVAAIWWAGHSYGPRLSTGTVPWLVLLGALALRARLDAVRADAPVPRTVRLAVAAVAAVALASVFIHARGALAPATQRWNLRPADLDADPGRIWEWRPPQWLAGLVPPPSGPVPPLALGQALELGRGEADAYLREGWSWPEGDLRWADEATARLQFAMDAPGASILRARLRRAPGGEADQAVEVELNGRALAAWTLGRETPVDVAAVVAGGLPRQNVLTFRLPDVPEVPPGRGDQRALRAAVYWLRFDPFPGLTLGEPVRFNSRAADPYLGEGWGEGEREYRWTIAPRAELFLSPGSLPPAVLRLQAHPYPVSARGSGQRVFVSVNGELVSTLALREEAPAVRSVPLLFGLPAAARVTLELPDAVAPRGDLRQLGMAVHWLRFDPWPRVPVGGVDLGGTSGDRFLGDGWAASEDGRRWTVGVSAEVYFAADPSPPARLVLTLDAFLHRRLPAQRVRFELNGERLDEVTVAEPGRRPVELPVPAGLLRPQNVLRLALPDARSPASLGASRDARVLGVRVGTLQLAPAAGHGVAPGASKP